ncbi:hypothetical protein [Glycomyces sp. NPDC047010]|uniref:hypothetical protein n=1 Tax=Glycomyces sp. NPDC047010 TaxID=3155023 RepID=UPI0033FB7F68
MNLLPHRRYASTHTKTPGTSLMFPVSVCRPKSRLFEPEPPANGPSQTPIRPVAHPRTRNRTFDPRLPDDQPPIAYPPAPERTLAKRLSPTDQAELEPPHPEQRDAIATNYATGGNTKTELARTYGVGLSTIKRILRETRQ